MKKNLVDPDDAPEITGDELHRPDAKWRIGGKEVSPEEGKAAFRKAWRRKIRTNIHLDSDVIAHYKTLAGPRGYQTLINAALRRDMEGQEMKAALLEEIDKRFARLTSAGGVITAVNGIPTNFANPSGMAFASAVAVGTVSSWPTAVLQSTDDDSLPSRPETAKTSANAQFLGLNTPTQGNA